MDTTSSPLETIRALRHTYQPFASILDEKFLEQIETLKFTLDINGIGRLRNLAHSTRCRLLVKKLILHPADYQLSSSDISMLITDDETPSICERKFMADAAQKEIRKAYGKYLQEVMAEVMAVTTMPDSQLKDNVVHPERHDVRDAREYAIIEGETLSDSIVDFVYIASHSSVYVVANLRLRVDPDHWIGASRVVRFKIQALKGSNPVVSNLRKISLPTGLPG